MHGGNLKLFLPFY